MPALLRAHEIGTRVAAVGFDWPTSDQVVDKIEEEVAELRSAVAGEGRERTEEEMGDLLFSIANLARKLGIEPESALRKANEKFSARFEALEGRFEAQGRSVHDASLAGDGGGVGEGESDRTRLNTRATAPCLRHTRRHEGTKTRRFLGFSINYSLVGLVSTQPR